MIHKSPNDDYTQERISSTWTEKLGRSGTPNAEEVLEFLIASKELKRQSEDQKTPDVKSVKKYMEQQKRALTQSSSFPASSPRSPGASKAQGASAADAAPKQPKTNGTSGAKEANPGRKLRSQSKEQASKETNETSGAKEANTGRQTRSQSRKPAGKESTPGTGKRRS